MRRVKTAGSTDISTLVEREEPVFGFASANFYPEFLAALEIYEQRNLLFPGIVVEPALRLKGSATCAKRECCLGCAAVGD